MKSTGSGCGSRPPTPRTEVPSTQLSVPPPLGHIRSLLSETTRSHQLLLCTPTSDSLSSLLSAIPIFVSQVRSLLTQCPPPPS